MSAAEFKEVEETAIATVSQESMGLYDKVKVLVVTDQVTHDLAVDLYKAAKELEKSVHAAHDPVCDHWNDLHKKATASRSKDLDKVVDAKKLAKKKADDWETEQERIRAEAQRKADEEARRVQAELDRQAREAAEAERKRLAAIEEEERLKLAMEAKEQGATEEQVTEILDAPVYIPEPEPVFAPVVVKPVVAPTFQKASGFTVRTNYSAAVTDLSALVKAAASTPFLMQYLLPNQQAINALAKASKDKFQLPGCQLKTERV